MTKVTAPKRAEPLWGSIVDNGAQAEVGTAGGGCTRTDIATALDAGRTLLGVSIAVLTYNRRRSVTALLGSLKSLWQAGVEVIVVDNHSQDGTEEAVRESFGWVGYIRTESNLGVGARNLALGAARGSIVICLDDDVFGLDEHAVRTICRAFECDRSLAAINFRVLDGRSGSLCNWVHHCDPGRYAEATFDTYEITEGAVAFRTEAVRRVGYYTSNFFLSHEGPDLAFRLLESGYRVVYRGDIVVRHFHEVDGRVWWANYYYDTRNQYWLAARHFPLGYAVAYLLRGQLSTLVYSIRDGHLRHWIRAVYDGVRGLPRALADRRPLSKTTMRKIAAVNARRPPLLRQIRARVFRRGMRL
jgi:GT2 family glycosyltransferase